MKLYHVSTIADLKELKPHISTHQKAYVYATTNPEFALLFGGIDSHGDLDGIYGLKDGVPFFYEAYKGALQRRFEGAVCYIYEVDPTTFKEGQTSFNGEVVSESTVKVLNCKKVENLYDFLIDLDKKSKLSLHFYEDTKNYVDMIDEHISDRIIKYGILDNKNSGTYIFCKEHFPDIVSRLES